MKKKILTIILGIALFIPISIVNASSITIDQIITELSNRLQSDEIQVQKTDTNKFKVTTTIDLSELYKTWPDGFVDDSDMKFSSYIEYEYNNSILSYKGNFGFSDVESDVLELLTSELISTQNSEFISTQNKEITKELTIAIYSLKGYQENEIIENLKKINILDQDENLNMEARTKSEGIETKIKDGWVSEYNIYVDEISINNSNNTEQNQNIDQTQNNQTNNNQTTDNQEKNKKDHVLTTKDNNYIISFTDDNLNIQFEFSVQSLKKLQETNEKKEQTDSVKSELENINKSIKNITKEIKDNGELIDIYDILVTHNEEQKTQGTFTFRIKLTEEMKKYNEFELINIDDEYKKHDIVKIKRNGEYLEGELPHLSTYALVGKTTSETIKNPSTGIKMYGTIGLLTIITLGGIYIIFKKKMSN